MPYSKAGALVVVVAVVLAAAPVVAAEDPRELQARRLYAKGEYDSALDVYATLFAESGDPLFLRNIGRCNQKLERPDKAIGAFRDYLRRGRKLKAAERQEIESYIKEMEELKARQDREAREKAAAVATPPKPAEPQPPLASPVSPPAAPEPPPAVVPPLPAATEAVPRNPDAAPGKPEDGLAQTPSPAPSTPAHPSFLVILAVGSGFGLATGTGELNPAHRLAAEGFAPAQIGHVAPQFGFFLTKKLILSAQLRLQYVSWVTGQHLIDRCGEGARYCEPSPLGIAAFARVGWLTGDGPVHFLGALAVGGGSIRHAQEFAADRECGPLQDSTCVDTLSGGPFLIGPSLALLVDLGANFGLMAALDTQVGYSRFTLNFDFNLGVTLKL